MLKTNFNIRISNVLFIILIFSFLKCNYKRKASNIYHIKFTEEDLFKNNFGWSFRPKIKFGLRNEDFVDDLLKEEKIKLSNQIRFLEPLTFQDFCQINTIFKSIFFENSEIKSFENYLNCLRNNELILLELILLYYISIYESCFLVDIQDLNSIIDLIKYHFNNDKYKSYLSAILKEYCQDLLMNHRLEIYKGVYFDDYNCHKPYLNSYSFLIDILKNKDNINIQKIKGYLLKYNDFFIIDYSDEKDQAYKKHLIALLSKTTHFYPISDFVDDIYKKKSIFYNLALWYSDFDEAIRKDHYGINYVSIISIALSYDKIFQTISKDYYEQEGTNTCVYNSIARSLAFLLPNNFLNKKNHRIFLLEAVKAKNNDNIMSDIKYFVSNNFSSEQIQKYGFKEKAYKILNDLEVKKTLKQIRYLDEEKKGIDTHYTEKDVEIIVKDLIGLSKIDFTKYMSDTEIDLFLLDKINSYKNKIKKDSYDVIINLLCPTGISLSNNSEFNVLKNYVEKITKYKYSIEFYSTHDFSQYVEIIKNSINIEIPVIPSFICVYDTSSKKPCRHAMVVIAYVVDPENQKTIGFWVLNTWCVEENKFFGYYSYEKFRKSLFSMGEYTLTKFVKL